MDQSNYCTGNDDEPVVKQEIIEVIEMKIEPEECQDLKIEKDLGSSSDSSEETSNLCDSKMALKAVSDALVKLTSNELSSDPINKNCTGVRDVFCFEDVFATKDLKITVDKIGKLTLPLGEDSVKKIINLSSKAKFGQGEATVLDTQVRDTQMIPASDLTVDIDKECLENLLTRAKAGLNLTQKCTLEPHLHNMLVYGPGQFFKMHRDSEKVPNMVATLVVVLPSFHLGGDLVIQHNDFKHIFFGSKNNSCIKCIIFYSDCLHEVQPVTEGYRVVITYNVVLKPSDESSEAKVNEALKSAVKDYFHSDIDSEMPEKLVYALNHSYSETNLKWNLLKGQDRTQAFALLAVANQENLTPCLALGDFRELFDIECDSDEEHPIEEEHSLDYWVDEKNVQFREDLNIDEEELCFVSKTKDLFEPYKTEASGPTGNEGSTVEHWYRRGFVVLWSNKWNFSHGYKDCLSDLHKSTSHKGKEQSLLEEINKNSGNFFQTQFWKDPDVIRYLVDIVIYLNDKKVAVSILSKLAEQIIQPDRIEWVINLEEMFDDKTWLKVLNHWSTNKWDLSKVPEFFGEYLKHPKRKSNSLIIKQLSDKHVQHYLDTNSDNNSWYRLDDDYFLNDWHLDKKVKNLFVELKICFDLGNERLENKIIQHVIENSKYFHPRVVSEFLDFSRGKQFPKQDSSCKCLRDTAIKCLETKILGLGDQCCWKILERLPFCYEFCDTCPLVEKFLSSKDSQLYSVTANETVRKHILKQLKELKKGEYLVFTTDKSKRPHTLQIKKDKRVFQENKCKVADLEKLKNKLEEMRFPQEVDNISGKCVKTSPAIDKESSKKPRMAKQSGPTTAKRPKM